MTYGDPLQHAWNADSGQIVVREATQKQSDRKDDGSPLQHMNKQFSAIVSSLNSLLERKRDRYTDDPEEERKYKIRERPA